MDNIERKNKLAERYGSKASDIRIKKHSLCWLTISFPEAMKDSFENYKEEMAFERDVENFLVENDINIYCYSDDEGMVNGCISIDYFNK